MTAPRLIQTYLLDGTLEGVRIIELTGSSDVKAFVVPRLKLADVKNREELAQPALYLLINSDESEIYIGESENFYERIRNHEQSKTFWDTAVAIVSTDNTLEKSDIKYLESLAIQKAKSTGAVAIRNKTAPPKNNVHEFKVHVLDKILEDVSLISESLSYSLFASEQTTEDTIWYCQTKKTDASGQFRGDKFVIFTGSVIDKSHAPSFEKDWPHSVAERDEIFTKAGKDLGDTVVLNENVPFKSPNHAGGFVTGRSVNAWTTWKNSDGKTMDEVMRKGGE